MFIKVEREQKQYPQEVSSSVIQQEGKKGWKKQKQLVYPKGWYKLTGVLVYNLVTFGRTILGGKEDSLFCTRD